MDRPRGGNSSIVRIAFGALLLCTFIAVATLHRSVTIAESAFQSDQYSTASGEQATRTIRANVPVKETLAQVAELKESLNEKTLQIADLKATVDKMAKELADLKLQVEFGFSETSQSIKTSTLQISSETVPESPMPDESNSADELVPNDLAPHKCRSNMKRVVHTFDPEENWKPPKQDPEVVNPYQKIPASGFTPVGPILIPSRKFSNSLGVHKYGGFTADIGWVLMVARYGLMPGVWQGQTPNKSNRNGNEYRLVQFPDYWGHGCDDNDDGGPEGGRWTCFFQPIASDELTQSVDDESVELFQEEKEDRGWVKMKQMYTPGNPESSWRNYEIQTISGVDQGPTLNEFTNDLQSMRYLFKWLFRLQPHVRAKVDEIKFPILTEIKRSLSGLDGNYAGMHIRWGDKVGQKAGPKEGSFISVQQYINRFFCYYKHRNLPLPHTIFIATDDYNAVKEAREILGPKFTVVTTAKEQHDGFSIVEYRKGDNKSKFVSALNLWADMELLASAETFFGTFESNIGKTVHMMRFGQDPKTSITMAGTHCTGGLSFRYSSNNFWMCSSGTAK